MSSEEAENIQIVLNLDEKDVAPEMREVFNFLKPSLDEFLLGTLPKIEL